MKPRGIPSHLKPDPMNVSGRPRHAAPAFAVLGRYMPRYHHIGDGSAILPGQNTIGVPIPMGRRTVEIRLTALIDLRRHLSEIHHGNHPLLGRRVALLAGFSMALAGLRLPDEAEDKDLTVSRIVSWWWDASFPASP